MEITCSVAKPQVAFQLTVFGILALASLHSHGGCRLAVLYVHPDCFDVRCRVLEIALHRHR